MSTSTPTMKSGPQIFALHYLFTKKGDRVAAHCLDLDLVAVGKDVVTAERRLNTLVKVQFAQASNAGNMAFAYFPAPPKLWAQLKRAVPLPPAILEIETPPMVLQVEQAVLAEVPVLRAQVIPQAA